MTTLDTLQRVAEAATPGPWHVDTMKNDGEYGDGGLLHLQETALARAKAAGHVADEYVHDNPWRAIGAAAGIGLLVGLLIGRR